ncbi:EamA family transporter RarD [bacterium LRH843]|nr:EamA family transporter RarD [bacterium LRH843]
MYTQILFSLLSGKGCVNVQDNGHSTGVIAAIVAYIIWGVLPLYWKLLDHLSAIEVLAQRIIWSLVFMVVLLLVQKQLRPFWKEVKVIFSNKKTAVRITLASLLISVNWSLFIWAVSNDRIIEASLGYYINPIINVILAMIFLKERLTRMQGASFFLAFIGVAIMTIYYGVFPWVALVLASSFSLYGLLKKVVHIGAVFSLTIETLLMTPLALLFILFSPLSSGMEVFVDTNTALILIGAGIVTATPLLLFSTAANRISLSLIGFLQYIGPTIMLFLGIFLYKEPFQSVQLFAFLFIWSGLLIFTFSSLKQFKKTNSQPAYVPAKQKSV